MLIFLGSAVVVQLAGSNQRIAVLVVVGFIANNVKLAHIAHLLSVLHCQPVCLTVVRSSPRGGRAFHLEELPAEAGVFYRSGSFCV